MGTRPWPRPVNLLWISARDGNGRRLPEVHATNGPRRGKAHVLKTSSTQVPKYDWSGAGTSICAMTTPPAWAIGVAAVAQVPRGLARAVGAAEAGSSGHGCRG
jgi:hypothetical protein